MNNRPDGLFACGRCGQVWVPPGFDRSRVPLFKPTGKVDVPTSDELRKWFSLEGIED